MTNNTQFKTLVNTWLNQKKPMITPSTHASFTLIAENHLIPYFGKRKIGSITEADIQSYISYLYNAGRLDKTGGLTVKTIRDVISLVIDIQNSIKAQESRGYEHWAKIHNLKQAARTLNFLTENRIDSYAELSAKIAEVNAASEQAAGSLKGVERRLADMAVLIKNVTTYQKTKPVYDAYRRAKDKAAYRAAHESSIILFEAAAKAVKPALVGGKLPNVAALQAEYAKLQEQKETLYGDYGRLKKQVKEYDVIKRNIDSILRRESEPERGKENVRG